MKSVQPNKVYIYFEIHETFNPTTENPIKNDGIDKNLRLTVKSEHY